MTFDVEKLQKILDMATESGEECGCQLAIYDHGRLAVSLVSGYTSAERVEKVTEDTLFPVYSCGKGLVSTAVHQLVEQGLMHYDDRVADVWPEFGCNGKEDIRLWHILNHRTGLHPLPEVQSYDELGDWDGMCKRMAEATPVVAPGTECHYQGITFAWLVGETVRRATGKSLKEHIQNNILDPLNIHSFFFGTTEKEDACCADVDDSLLKEDQRPSWMWKFFHSLPTRHGFVPSANGCGNALALARHYSALLDDTDGVRLLKPETVELTTKLRRADNDPIVKDGQETWEKFGLGYALLGALDANLGHTFGHGGALGSEGFADRDRGIAVGFTKNRVSPNAPNQLVRNRISAELGLRNRIW